MKTILDIINPVHDMTVKEWEKVGTIIHDTQTPPRTDIWYIIFTLIQRWEAITRQPLTKSMFVNSVEKPKRVKVGVDQYLPDEYVSELDAFEAAQSEVLFEGFKGTSFGVEGIVPIVFDNETGYIHIPPPKTLDMIKLNNPTISDLITEISRYNRTSKTPIAINWTENLVKKLIA